MLLKVLSALAACKVNPIMDLNFTVKNPDGVKEDLLRNAAENATKKAKALCEASNAKLGRLINIDYNWNNLDFNSMTNFNYNRSMLINTEEISVPNINPDDVRLHDTATFTLKIQ